MARFSLQMIFAVFALTIASCSTTGGAQKGANTEATTTLEALVPLPGSVNKLAIQKRHVYEEASAGVQYRYAGDLTYFADVFVYPLKEHQNEFLVSGDENALVADEFNRFRAELDYAIQQGWYQSVEPVEQVLQTWSIEMEINGASRNIPFLVATGEYRVRKDNQELASFVTLSEFNGYFVKVRLSHPDYPGLREEAKNFSKNLFEALYRSQRQLDGIEIESDDGQKVTVGCQPGESMLSCLSRAMRAAVEKDT